MPRLTVWMVRAALAYLAVGFTLGGLLLWNKGLPLTPALWQALPAHVEFLLVGWTVQLVIGMAFWILPRFSVEPRRGNVKLAWLSFALLNLGILAIAFSPLLAAWRAGVVFAGRMVECLGAAAFAAHAWPRVKPSR